MAILSGKRLGPDEILSAIGAGGMGEVYRARDTRLERIVAVKILPDHLSDRAELRERFEREAQAHDVLHASDEEEITGISQAE
jgi:serine/threonine protein kinase